METTDALTGRVEKRYLAGFVLLSLGATLCLPLVNAPWEVNNDRWAMLAMPLAVGLGALAGWLFGILQKRLNPAHRPGASLAIAAPAAVAMLAPSVYFWLSTIRSTSW